MRPGAAELAASNNARAVSSRKLLDAALAKPTIKEALEEWGGTEPAFWKAARRAGLDMEARERYGVPTRAQVDAASRAALIEDAEFLACHGEVRERAYKRLGFNSWDSLYARLENYGRLDIADHLTRNGEAVGHVHQGSVYSSTNGARMP